MKTLAWRLFFAVLFSMPLCATPLAVRDLGIPVKGVSWTRLHPGKTADGRASLLISMGQNHGGLFVLDVDLATGRCRQFAAADGVRSTFPTAAYRSLRTGILYLGSAWDGHLHRFDANHPERGIEDLGRVDEAGTFGLGITETPDGAIWIGSYPGARLTKFDPATGQFTRHGRKDATDEYLYPLGGDDGSLAAIVKVVRPHLLLIDPATGAHREVGPTVTDPSDKTQFLKLFKGTDRRLYLDSHAGRFRIDGLLLTPVDELPAPLPGVHATYKHNYQAPAEMPGGWTAHFLDDSVNGVGTPRNLLLTHRDPLVPSRRLHLDWVGGGSNLHVMELGPDGHLYGSSYMPNRLFRASLDGATVEDLGEHTFAGGEAYSLATLDGKIYLASYPEARLSVFDPARPVRFGTTAADNPQDLGRLDAVSYRPNALLTTPDGRLWMGSSPDYGLRNGTLAWYEPKTGAKKSHRTIVPDTSPAAMLWLPDQQQILIGLSIEAGTGVSVSRLNGAFALWDPAKDELVWSGDCGIEDLADVTSLAPAGNGLVYALIGRGDHILSAGAPPVRPRLALIDPARRAVVDSAWLPEDFGPLSWHGLFSLRPGPGGAVYGATGYCLFRIKPGTCEVERLWQPDVPPVRADPVWLTHSTPDAIDVVGPIIGHRFYFATGWRLRVLTLPE
jgi:hypothetical protein